MVVGKTTQLVNFEYGTGAEEQKVVCMIRDMVDSHSNATKQVLNLPGSSSVRIFLNEISKHFGYMIGTISVHYEKETGEGIEELRLEQHKDSFLPDILNPQTSSHNFTICELEGTQPKKMPPPPPKVTARTSVDETSTSESSTNLNNSTSCKPQQSNSSSSNASSSYSSDFSYSNVFIKSDTGYVGLVNQAMTCYLNSLIQTLYMTPEFRNAIYRYHFSSDKGVKNIPYQLQRLFLLLQTSKNRAVETTDLTKSFGWDSSEAWQQHDVQELCRVMFDALEVSWRGTDQEDLINQLYQGKMKDYVKCLECGNESAREDTFLDIPLVIRPFGSTMAYKSIQEALLAFVQPEILEGRDQYFCEKCNKKCDAHKGLKFLSFPYLLTLQMKRFDFDYSTMHRIKLNDRMTFPEVLNLNTLTSNLACKEKKAEDLSSSDLKTTSAKTEISIDDAVDKGTEVEACVSGGSSNEESHHTMLKNKNIENSDVKGPYMYELFSIMIHSGSAAGGHYYAYIKCVTDGQWYSFNDQHVSTITYDDIRKMYGGSTATRGYYSSYASSANAYMLMYRKIDKDRNADFLSADDFPEHVKEELRRLNDKEEENRKQKEIDKSTCKINIFCNHPVLKKKLDHKLEIHKDKTLADAMEIAYKMFNLEGVVSRDCCRIVKYDDYQDSLESSFVESEDTRLEHLLGGVKQSYSFDLLLETKCPEQRFQEYQPGGLTVKVYIADMAKDTIIEPPANIRAYLTQTVGEFSALVTQVLCLSPHSVNRCVLERYHNDLKLLHNPRKTLKSEGFFKTNKVYVEINGNPNDLEVPYDRSHFYRLLDRYQNTICIQVNLPTKEQVAEYERQSPARDQSSACQDSAVESRVKSAENSVNNSVDLCNHGQGPRGLNEDLQDQQKSPHGDIDIEMRLLNLQSPLSCSDPILYSNRHSGELTADDILTSLQREGSRSSLECQDSRSSSACAECSLGNINSVCDANIESSEDILIDSSDCKGDDFHFSDKSHDLEICVKCHDLGDCDKCHNFNNSYKCHDLEGIELYKQQECSEPVDHSFLDMPNLSSASLSKTLNSPADKHEPFFNSSSDMPRSANWDMECTDVGHPVSSGLDSEMSSDAVMSQFYFHALLAESETDQQRSLSVLVDKRITLAAFKTELEHYVGVPASDFKVYRVYSNDQEFESIRLAETLSFLEDGKINIKLGRALKTSEYRVKVYQLQVNEAEPIKFLIDTIFARGMTVLESKELILPDLKAKLNMVIPLDRCRLRKKTWKNPGTIYVDWQVYEDEIPIYANWEVFLEILDGPDTMVDTKQLAVYLRRWYPSQYELGPFEEVVITQHTVEELKILISELSGINADDVEIAKGRGTFPYDMSLLEIDSDLDWNPSVCMLGMCPLYICDDGCLVYYRDRKEKLAELSEERRKEIETRENTRLSRSAHKAVCSPRKERALKIYTGDQPLSGSTTASNISSDLD